jgi:predicted amidohydrolase YtcJ
MAYTLGGAFASFEEEQKGIIAPGRLADLTMIDKDLRAIAPADIRTAAVVRTIVGGRTVFAR